MVDRVRALKIERTSAGGGQSDRRPRSLNPNEDFLDARGAVFQNNTSADDIVNVSRDVNDNLTFKDGVVAGSRTLSELLGGAVAAFNFGRVNLTVEPDDDEIEGDVTGLGAVTRCVAAGYLIGNNDEISEELAAFKVQVTELTIDGFKWAARIIGDSDGLGGTTNAQVYFDYIYRI